MVWSNNIKIIIIKKKNQKQKNNVNKVKPRVFLKIHKLCRLLGSRSNASGFTPKTI